MKSSALALLPVKTLGGKISDFPPLSFVSFPGCTTRTGSLPATVTFACASSCCSYCWTSSRVAMCGGCMGIGSPSWRAKQMLVRWGCRCITSSSGWSVCLSVATYSRPVLRNASSLGGIEFMVAYATDVWGAPCAGSYRSLSSDL